MFTRICKNCGKEIKTYHKWPKKVYCNKKCFFEKRSEIQKLLWQQEEYRNHMTKVHTGRVASEKTRKKMSKSLRGIKRTDIWKQRISHSNTGKIRSKMVRQKMSDIRRGKHLSENTKQKLRDSQTGEKGSNWQGGISYEPYTIDWTKMLRENVRQRDKYICQLCGKSQNARVLSVHHIDYNKRNCTLDNLITLCVSCNSKVNYNREYWKNYFNNILIKKL